MRTRQKQGPSKGLGTQEQWDEAGRQLQDLLTKLDAMEDASGRKVEGVGMDIGKDDVFIWAGVMSDTVVRQPTAQG